MSVGCGGDGNWTRQDGRGGRKKREEGEGRMRRKENSSTHEIQNTHTHIRAPKRYRTHFVLLHTILNQLPSPIQSPSPIKYHPQSNTFPNSIPLSIQSPPQFNPITSPIQSPPQSNPLPIAVPSPIQSTYNPLPRTHYIRAPKISRTLTHLRAPKRSRTHTLRSNTQEIQNTFIFLYSYSYSYSILLLVLILLFRVVLRF